MVKAQIHARNPQDNVLRIWGLGIDKIPTGNWLKDPAVLKSNRHQGDMWEFDLNVPEGKHVLYFIVSQTNPDKGGYEGEALFGQAGFSFKGIDNDTIAEFPVMMKGSKLTRDSAVSQAKSTDIETTSTSSSGFHPWQTIKGTVTKVKTSVTAEPKKYIVIGGVIVAVPLIGFAAWKMYKKKRRF